MNPVLEDDCLMEPLYNVEIKNDVGIQIKVIKSRQI